MPDLSSAHDVITTPVIRRLPETLVNRIAAGEVIERPAAVVKELVENAIDAGARQIDICLRDGGRSEIIVADNGCGMDRASLLLAVERHATSKLQDDQLVQIHTLGFRGEALPSIGAVARLTLISRPQGTDHAWSLSVNGGKRGEPVPAARAPGTTITVRDLFYATPARLKFLKSPRTEHHQALEVLRRLALSHPDTGFSARIDDRNALRLLPAADLASRVYDVLGRDLVDNMLPLDGQRDHLRLHGLAGLPTHHRPTANDQYLFVNNRPIRDRQILGALKAAYRDFLPHDRHPVVVLFLELPAHEIDVNVHPAKTDIRFRDYQQVRGAIITLIQQALASAGHRTSNATSQRALNAFSDVFTPKTPPHMIDSTTASGWQPMPLRPVQHGFGDAVDLWVPAARSPVPATTRTPPPPTAPSTPEAVDFPLGAAVAQIHNTYIIAQTGDGLVIVDQHAAHERLVYEQIKEALNRGGVPSQALLMPEVIELSPLAVSELVAAQEALQRLGLELEAFGPGAVMLRAVPVLLGKGDWKALIRDLADRLMEDGDTGFLTEKLYAVCASMACHGSVRAGRPMNIHEMNNLLRDMERTPGSGQCNHGRPTSVTLSLSQIERLFGRK